MTKKSANVTQAEIARQLNLSTVTVSKALRDHPDISAETTAQVKKVAEQLDYRPDLIARALSSRRSHIIGAVMPEIDHTFFASVMKGIQDVAQDHRYQIILTVSNEDEKQELESIQTLISMRIDGILISISSTTTRYDIFDTIKSKGIPLVFFDRHIMGSGFSSVIVDDRQGAFNAVEYAIGQGYREIMHFSGPPLITIADERKKGFLDAVKQYGLPFEDAWIVPCGCYEADGYREFMTLVRTGRLPEAVFTFNDPVAIGIYDAARESGLRIPGDIGVIGFSDNIISRYLSPPLTTVEQPAVEIGKSAVSLLLEEIQKGQPSIPRQVVVPTRLVIRDSCRKTGS
ncbi:LacI family DNA-binding transcriptional regulator [bacterium]|nr:LacI family DNA-binding transcriptional regulator [bacterium]